MDTYLSMFNSSIEKNPYSNLKSEYYGVVEKIAEESLKNDLMYQAH